MFRINEVIVVDEEVIQDDVHSISQGAALLARLLQYQETPQYLRKFDEVDSVFCELLF